MRVHRFAALGLVCGALGLVSVGATTYEVSHSPTAGQFSSITAALAVAGNDDTIEVVDNSAPFIESLNIADKGGLILQGQEGLTPRPTIQGVAVTHPIEPATYPNGTTIVYTGNSMNVQLRNLIVDATANNNAVETRFITPALVENVKIVLGTTGTDAKRGIFASNDLVVRGCEIEGNGNGIEHWFGGSISVVNTKVAVGRNIVSAEQGVALYMHGGTLHVDHSNIQTLSPEQAVRFVFADEITNGDSVNIIENSELSSGYTGTDNNLLIVCRQHTNKTKVRSITIDNCDLIGSQVQQPSTTFHAIGSEVGMDAITFVDSIVYNTQANFFANYANLAAEVLTEDYCAFQKTIRDVAAGAFTPGLHSVVLADTDPLYVDAANGDFRLIEGSVARTLNSTGTPAYAGSKGPLLGPSAARHWSLY